MTLLETSQIIFNLVASIAIVVVSLLICIIAFDIIKFFKNIKKVFNDVTEKSNELYGRIDDFLANIAALPFLSRLFKKKKSK